MNEDRILELIESNHQLIKLLETRIKVDEEYFKEILRLRR